MVPRTRSVTENYTVMVPERRERTEKYVVQKPVYETQTREYQVSVPTYRDVEYQKTVQVPVWRDVPRQYGTEKFPESFLIDKNGDIRYYIVSDRDWNRPEVTACIEAMAAN